MASRLHMTAALKSLKPCVSLSAPLFVMKRIGARFQALDLGSRGGDCQTKSIAVTASMSSITVDSSPRARLSDPGPLPPIKLQKTLALVPTPVTPVVSEFSKRVFYQRRLHMLNRNLLIVLFDGVVGSYSRLRPWSRKRPRLTLRESACKGLSQLQAPFQLVLFFLNPQQKIRPILKSFVEAGVQFDGIYRNTTVTSSYPYVQNYDQVLSDFGATASNVLV